MDVVVQHECAQQPMHPDDYSQLSLAEVVEYLPNARNDRLLRCRRDRSNEHNGRRDAENANFYFSANPRDYYTIPYQLSPTEEQAESEGSAFYAV